jgi:hypothetical protein
MVELYLHSPLCLNGDPLYFVRKNTLKILSLFFCHNRVHAPLCPTPKKTVTDWWGTHVSVEILYQVIIAYENSSVRL